MAINEVLVPESVTLVDCFLPGSNLRKQEHVWQLGLQGNFLMPAYKPDDVNTYENEAKEKLRKLRTYFIVFCCAKDHNEITYLKAKEFEIIVPVSLAKEPEFRQYEHADFYDIRGVSHLDLRYNLYVGYRAQDDGLMDVLFHIDPSNLNSLHPERTKTRDSTETYEFARRMSNRILAEYAVLLYPTIQIPRSI